VFQKFVKKFQLFLDIYGHQYTIHITEEEIPIKAENNMKSFTNFWLFYVAFHWHQSLRQACQGWRKSNSCISSVTVDFLPNTIDGVLQLHLDLGLLDLHPVLQEGALLNAIVLLVRPLPLVVGRYF
jgi:hypothetical protein